MFDKQNIARQHQDILKITKDILAYRTPEEATEHAFSIAMLISQLAGRIQIHLSTEDQHVYPSFLNNPDAKVQQLSIRFSTEMGDLAQKFNDFKSRYTSSSYIKQNAATFLYDAKAIMESINERIEREDRELYPLMK